MNHEVIATRVEHIAMATGIIAGLSAVAATIATPTGLSAFGVWLGLVDEPLIVTVAPILDKLATVCGTISGMTYFYAVRKKRQTAKQSVSDHSAPSD
ncbi:hypothetical protein JWZ98_14995 [Methylomonas sp. EFPC1]|uniref:Holin n=1 Tax=Methylomonas defluvii TaxID=3045149 RepID=A0ABU4ULC4_9GAMM|nr:MULTISPECIES: hypothetical protein [unclassified Methylomonas]MDX8130298.1 hypothetical protein [Methylomonas sp. OY6]QBC28314.1 hypothetical protein U737_16225 [Methylomonas sp. LW13]QSA99983.1 hypothetical protein JWZ98_14995 [Methylomonas sp. EFPC1]